jgi:hypothetical protein
MANVWQSGLISKRWRRDYLIIRFPAVENVIWHKGPAVFILIKPGGKKRCF